jgi:hypothetical protein
MQIKEVSMPLIMSYYIREDVCKSIHDSIINGKTYLSEPYLNVYTTNDNDIADSLRVFKDKTIMITVGNQRKYEYEMDISSPNGHLFTLIDEANASYRVEINYIDVQSDNEVHINFKIV